MTFMKCKLGTGARAAAAFKTAFTAKPRSICSYIDMGPVTDRKYESMRKYGKCVWCWDFTEVGNGATFHNWKKSDAAFFWLAYMV